MTSVVSQARVGAVGRQRVADREHQRGGHADEHDEQAQRGEHAAPQLAPAHLAPRRAGGQGSRGAGTVSGGVPRQLTTRVCTSVTRTWCGALLVGHAVGQGPAAGAWKKTGQYAVTRAG